MIKIYTFISTLLIAISSFAEDKKEHLITHDNVNKNFDISIYQQYLSTSTSLSIPINEALDLLEQLSKFELGRFLLANKGLNGYWTAYVILHGRHKTNLNPLEHWLLNKAPTLKATQDRFQIFRQQLQKYLKSDTKITSIPCGLMDDLLGLDYTYNKNIHLVGIDLDENSLQLAQENANKYKIDNVSFKKKDAWHLGITEEYDIITSNGLNIYQPDDEKVIKLYQEFYNALKPDGILITSFLTPPPLLSKESTWKNYDQEAAAKQKIIFSEILQVAWQAFRTEAKTRTQLETAGFTIIDVIYDPQGMFPTVVAQKINAKHQDL